MSDKPIAFLKSWRDAEYNALVAMYTERDDKAYQVCYKKLQAFYNDGLLPEVHRPESPPNNWFEQGEQVVQDILVCRAIFQVKVYTHPHHQELWRCYISHTTRPRDDLFDYFANVFVAKQKDAYKIISLYQLDDEAESLSTDLRNWNYRGGEEIEHLGTLSRVYKVGPPHNQYHRAEYNAE